MSSVASRDRLTGAALIMAPLAFLAAIAALPDAKNETAVATIAAYAGHHTRVVIADTLAFLTIALMVPALIGLTRLLRRQAPVLAVLGGALALAGMIAFVGQVVMDGVGSELARSTLGPAQAATLLDHIQNSAQAQVSQLVFVAGHLLGFALLGIALLRTRLIPRWAAIAVIVASPLHAVAHAAAIKPLDIVAFALLAVGLGAVGLRLWTATGKELFRPAAAVPEASGA